METNAVVDGNVVEQAAAGVQGLFAATPTWVETAQEMMTTFGLKLIAAILIFVIGRWVARLVQSGLRRTMEKGKVEKTLIGFSTKLFYIALMAFVVIAALGKLGIQTASFIAVLGAAGLAVGLALQGSLSNFAAGVLMLIFRPFKIGDFIEGGGTAGTVREIHIFTTTLTTPDNKRVIVPNSKMMGDNITNYSAESTRRVDILASISYNDDIDKAKEVLMGIITSDERVLKDPKPLVAVKTMNDSSVDLVVRSWVNSADYWAVYFALTEAIKKGLEAEGLSIPYPQQDVHIYKHGAE